MMTSRRLLIQSGFSAFVLVANNCKRSGTSSESLDDTSSKGPSSDSPWLVKTRQNALKLLPAQLQKLATSNLEAINRAAKAAPDLVKNLSNPMYIAENIWFSLLPVLAAKMVEFKTGKPATSQEINKRIADSKRNFIDAKASMESKFGNSQKATSLAESSASSEVNKILSVVVPGGFEKAVKELGGDDKAIIAAAKFDADYGLSNTRVALTEEDVDSLTKSKFGLMDERAVPHAIMAAGYVMILVGGNPFLLATGNLSLVLGGIFTIIMGLLYLDYIVN
jgi:hypothetical protein